MKTKARLKTCESVVSQGISAVGVLPSQLQAWCYSKNSKSTSSRQKHFGRRRGKRQSLRQLASRPSSALETETNIWTCPWQQSGSQCWTQRRWYRVLLSGWKSGGHLQHDLEVPQVKAGEAVPCYSTLQQAILEGDKPGKLHKGCNRKKGLQNSALSRLRGQTLRLMLPSGIHGR